MALRSDNYVKKYVVEVSVNRSSLRMSLRAFSYVQRGLNAMPQVAVLRNLQIPSWTNLMRAIKPRKEAPFRWAMRRPALSTRKTVENLVAIIGRLIILYVIRLKWSIRNKNPKLMFIHQKWGNVLHPDMIYFVCNSICAFGSLWARPICLIYLFGLMS